MRRAVPGSRASAPNLQKEGIAVKEIELTGNEITLEQIKNVARQGAKVTLSSRAKDNIQRSREVVDRLVEQSKVVYGVTTGFGMFSETFIQKEFTNALQKGMDYVQNHTPEEIASVIQPQFEETDVETITTIVTRYYEQDSWKDNLVFEEDAFTLLQNILEEAGELEKRVPYEDLVDTSFAEDVK